MAKSEHHILIRKILIVVLDNIGDAVMATALLRPVQKLFPGATIGFWTKSYVAPVFEDHSLIDNLHASDPFWDTAPGRKKGSWDAFRSTWSDVRAEGYDAALILNTEWRRAMACWFAKIPIRVGFKRRKSRFFLTHPFPAVEDNTAKTREHRTLIESWSRTVLPDDLWVPRVEKTMSETTWVRSWREGKKWQNNPLVVMHPFAGDPVKCWPVEKWIELIRALSAKHETLRFVFSCMPAEKPKLESAMRMASRDKCDIVAATYTELKGLLSGADLFIGGDSGPGHVAAAMGVPVLSLFGPTNPLVYAPVGRAFVNIINAGELATLPMERVREEAVAMLQGTLQKTI